MSAGEWASESGKGLAEIAVKGFGGGGIIGGIAGIIAAAVYAQQPAKAYLCSQAGGTVRRSPDVLGRPPSVFCNKIINGPFGEWSSAKEAGFQLGFAVLLVVFVIACCYLLAQNSNKPGVA